LCLPDDHAEIDATQSGHIARYVNHACQPNLVAKEVISFLLEPFPRIAYFAKKNIRAGDELTIDYNPVVSDNNPNMKLCRCSTNCKNRVI
jgi:SET domain-containing protein